MGQLGRAVLDAVFQLVVRRLEIGVALLDLREHFVEPVDELADFVLALLAGAHGIILPLGDLAGGLGQPQDGMGDEPLQPGGKNEGDEG